jgi:hypothetical protein
MTLTPQSLLADLDTTLAEVSQDWRATVLGQIADLFLNSAHRYSKDQVALFDTVMSLLIPGVDRLTLASLSDRLTDGRAGGARRGADAGEVIPTRQRDRHALEFQQVERQLGSPTHPRRS